MDINHEMDQEMDHEMVFIIGLPRTGSTLLRSILNRSPSICISAETHFLTKWARSGRQKRLLKYGDLQSGASVGRFLDDIFSSQRASGNDFWAWLNRHITRADFRQRLESTDRSDRAIFELLIDVYAIWKKGEIQPGLILGEKTSGNIYLVSTLLEWYPGAKLIHTFRDPRAIFVSAARLAKDGKWGVKNRLRHIPRPLLDPMVDLVMAVYILRYWLDATRFHTEYAQRYPDQYTLVRFEDLVQDPAHHIQQVCNFIRVPYVPDMIEEVAVVGSSFNAQRVVPSGIEKQVADRWRNHIHPWTQAVYSTIGRRQLRCFGYTP
jgi:hypothetical protein